LEYANHIDPGWGKVKVGQPGSPQLACLLELHEFYFKQTEREPYLAVVQGANLVREILDQLNRRAGRKSSLEGKCPRATADSQFVGLVGHDTNLANVGTLLHVDWDFENNQLPPDTRDLPKNDALPAGALVFELREGSPDYRVRIQYVTQSLTQMRNAPEQGEPFRLLTTCRDDAGHPLSPCEITLPAFNKLLETGM